MKNVTRLFDFPYYQQDKYISIPDALVTKQNGVWVKTSTEEYISKANAVSRALLRMGVKKDDKIAIISTNNRTEWNIMDIGVLQTGAQTIPIYPTISEDDYEYILNHSGAIYCFVSDEEVLKKVNAIKAKYPGIKVIYTRDKDVFVELDERAKIANRAKADLFISIHCNDMPVKSTRYISGYVKNKKGKRVPVYKTRYAKSTSTRGVETFVSGSGRLDEQDDVIKRENAAMFLEDNYKENYEGFDDNEPESAIILSLMKNSFRTQSLKFAKYIQDQYVAVGRINRGVQEKSLAVLARAGMPAVLTEIGFISNPGEEDYMNSEAGQIEITNCLLKAIQAYKMSIEL